MIYLTGNNAYSVVHDHKNGWNPEAFRERFSEVLERYDYIVGDWGYNQLRLRGFFREPQPKVPKESVISHLYEYIHEYCNFGCAYFVIEKLDPAAVPEGAGVRLEELPAQTAPTADAEAGEAAAGQDGEPAAQAPAPAAISLPASGMLMRWPLKERPGGRVPGTSPSAVARAVSEGAERRAAAAQTAAASSREEMYGRGGSYEGARQDRGGDGRDRKSGGGYRGSQAGGGYERRSQGGGYNKQEHRHGAREGAERLSQSGGESGGYRGGGHSSGGPQGGNRSGGVPGKWPNNKNRRRGPHGGGQQSGGPQGAQQQAGGYPPRSPGGGQPSGRPRHEGGGQRSEHAQRQEHVQRPGGAPRGGGGPRPEGAGRPDRGTPAGE